MDTGDYTHSLGGPATASGRTLGNPAMSVQMAFMETRGGCVAWRWAWHGWARGVLLGHVGVALVGVA